MSGAVGGYEIVNNNHPQVVYLDFDGAVTSYNGMLLTLDYVSIGDSGLAGPRAEEIAARLNEQFRSQNIYFTLTEPPSSMSFSTVYVGKSDSFEELGNFWGLSETIDAGNQIKDDNAFVFADQNLPDHFIAALIAHEVGHLTGESHVYANGTIADYAALLEITRWGDSYNLEPAVSRYGKVEIKGSTEHYLRELLVEQNFPPNTYIKVLDGYNQPDMFTVKLNPGESITISISADKPLSFFAYVGGAAPAAAAASQLTGYAKSNTTNTTFVIDYNPSWTTIHFYVGVITNPKNAGSDIIKYTVTSQISRPTFVDLSVLSVSPAQSQVAYGGSVELTFSVKNSGGRDAGNFYATVSIDDKQIKKVFCSAVGGGASVQYKAMLDLSGIALGSHTIKVVADSSGQISESNENNNTASSQLTVVTPVGGKADLTVTSVSLSNTSIEVGSPVTVTFTVKNTGNAAANAFYSDIFAGTLGTGLQQRISCGALNPGASATYQYTISGGSLGIAEHLIKVVADSGGQVTESDESNNSAAKNLSVTRRTGADLTILDAALTKTVVTVGESVDLTFTVQNVTMDNCIANDEGWVSIINLYDEFVKLDRDRLNPGASQDFTYRISTSGLSIGNHEITVRSVAWYDINSANNQQSITLSVVSTAQHYADLTVKSVVLSKFEAYSTDQVQLDFLIKNTGNTATWGGDAYIYDGDEFLGRSYFGATAAGGAAMGSFTISSGSLTAGVHSIRVVVDGAGEIAESNENNNSLAAAALRINAPLADLKILYPQLAKSTVTEREAVSLSFLLRNSGIKGSSYSQVAVYDDDTLLGVISDYGLDAGSSSSRTYSIAAGQLSVGTHHLRLVADCTDSVAEYDEDNNRSMALKLTVTAVDPRVPYLSANTESFTGQVTLRALFAPTALRNEYSSDGGNSWLIYSSAVTVTDNGNYLFRSMFADGKVFSEEYRVDNISPQAAPPVRYQIKAAADATGALTIKVAYLKQTWNEYSLDGEEWCCPVQTIKANVFANRMLYLRTYTEGGLVTEVEHDLAENADDNWQWIQSTAVSGLNGRLQLTGGRTGGAEDPCDYVGVDIKQAGEYNFILTDVEANTTLTLYRKVYAANGKVKLAKIKNISVNSSGMTGNLLLTASEYVFNITAAQNSGYLLYIDGKAYSWVNNADDDWHDSTQLGLTGYGQTVSDQVGFGDAVDYFKLDLPFSGSYDLIVSGLTGSVEVSVWEKVVNARGVASLKKVTTETVAVKTDRQGNITVNSGRLDHLLLAADSEYYLSVAASGVSKGQNTAYRLSCGGTVFDHPGNLIADNVWRDSQIREFDLLAGIADEWVGYGDAADFFHFEVTSGEAGRYDFDFAPETAKYATMKLYRVTQKNGKEVLTALKAAPGDVFDLSAGDYALKIASADNGRGMKNTAYAVGADKLF